MSRWTHRYRYKATGTWRGDWKPSEVTGQVQVSRPLNEAQLLNVIQTMTHGALLNIRIKSWGLSETHP